jgi:Stage II sporulation protein M
MMDVNQLALVRGMGDTRAALDRWNRNPGPVLRAWLLWSVAIAFGLLGAVWLVAVKSTPDATGLIVHNVNHGGDLGDALDLFRRNLLVLALHSMACVAGFIAGSSLPQIAESRTGLSRWVHEKAGPLAIGFVVCATAFSLMTQAYALGSGASTIAWHFETSPGLLLLCLLPHALPELTALFLPLAAWIIASRAGRWDELLTATFVTTALALPTLLAACVVEIFVSPILIHAVIEPPV